MVVAFATHARAGQGDNGGLPPATGPLAQAIGWRVALAGEVAARNRLQFRDASHRAMVGRFEGCVVTDFGNEPAQFAAALRQAVAVIEAAKLRAVGRGITPDVA